MKINYWNCIVFDGQNINIVKETAGILWTLNYNKKENRSNVNCISFCLDYKIAIQIYLSTMNLYTSYTSYTLIHIIYTYTHHTQIIHTSYTHYVSASRYHGKTERLFLFCFAVVLSCIILGFSSAKVNDWMFN